MKFLLITLLTTSISPAWSNSAWDGLSRDLDKRIEYLQMHPKYQSYTINHKANVDSNKNQKTLAKIIEGYNYLKKYSLPYRYQFMFDGTNALLKSDKAVTNWINSANTELKARNFHPQFYQGWSEHYKNIQTANTELTSNNIVEESTTGQVTIDRSDEIRFLSQLSSRIIAIQNETNAAKEEQKTVTQSSDIQNFVQKHQNTALLSFAGLLSLMMFMKVFRKKKVAVKKVKKTKVVQVKKEVAQAVAEFDAEIANVQIPMSNLENSYKECIEKNAQLLRQAELNVVNSLQSPFSTEVYVEKERLDKALNFLMRGTLAIVNTSPTKASHLEWNCFKSNQRLSLNLVLHGLNCEEKDLYLNTLVDGEYSGPAFFGRAEQTLEEHSPTVVFKNQDKKTTISLTFDSIQENIGH